MASDDQGSSMMGSHGDLTAAQMASKARHSMPMTGDTACGCELGAAEAEGEMAND